MINCLEQFHLSLLEVSFNLGQLSEVRRLIGFLSLLTGDCML